MAIQVETHRFADSGKLGVVATIDDCFREQTAIALLREIVKQIAEKYVAENYQEIVAGISQEAIATLSVAESAAKIRESLEKSIPGRVERVVEKQIYQRGLLGGIKRIG